jgi:hypothetical protein
VNLRASCGDWELAGPRDRQVVPGGPVECWQAAGTSSHFTMVQGSATGAVEIEVVGPAEAQLQVTALPLEADRPRLDLREIPENKLGSWAEIGKFPPLDFR